MPTTRTPQRDWCCTAPRPASGASTAPGIVRTACRNTTPSAALSVGALGTIWLLHLIGGSTRLGAAAVTSLLVGVFALGASTLHLGRPIYAYRALKMWRRSWLSREVLLFAAFSNVACVYAAMLW